MRRLVPLLVIAAFGLLGASAAAQVPQDQIVDEAVGAARGVLGLAEPATPVPRSPPIPLSSFDPTAIGIGLAASALIAGGIRHINRTNVLEHPARQRIYEHLWETGGANLRAISDALELSTTNTTWHLDKLIKAELVGEAVSNGYKMYYPRGAGRLARDLCVAKGVLANGNARAILETVQRDPGTHQREIARVLDVNHGTVRWHLQRLEEAGLIRAGTPGNRQRGFAVTPLGEQALVGPSGARPLVSQVS